MPQAIGLFLFTLGAPIGIVNFFAVTLGTGLLSSVFSIGLSLGLSYLASSLFRPQINAPRPEDVQQSLRQPTAPRLRHVGRVKVSGSWVMAEAYQGNFHKVLALGVGPIDAFEELWIDDTQVSVDGSGVVTTAPWTSKARIQTRLGLATETAYSDLTAVFPEWTSAHRGDGVASLYAKQYAVNSAAYLSTFPNGIQTNYRAVIRGATLRPFGGGTATWDDNAARVIYDYMTSADGMRLPTAVTDTPQALAGWAAAYARAGEAVDVKGGGTVERYRLWGSYRLDERPADVLSRMLAACDGRLKPTSDGGLTLDIGDWAEPSVTLDAEAIIGFTDVARGRDVLNTANTVRATYLEPESDYQSADADPWVDAADVTARGELSLDTSFIMAPSHSQARRLMKLTWYRANPNWVGVFECNLRALAAIDQRFVRITYPLFGIDEVFEIQDMRLNIADGDVLQSVTITANSMPQAAYQWAADQDEGDAPVSDSADVDNDIPLPTDFNVVISTTTIGGSAVPVAVMSWDTPPSVSLTVQAQGKASADSTWTDIAVTAGVDETTSFPLAEDADYDFRIRFVTIGLREGAWANTITIKADTDATAPTSATGVSGTGGAGEADIDFTSPSDANYACMNIYRHTANVFASATFIGRVFGDPSTADTYTDTGLAAGTYYYWCVARNTVGDEATEVATGAVAVT
jgi:hypothetical protein